MLNGDPRTSVTPNDDRRRPAPALLDSGISRHPNSGPPGGFPYLPFPVSPRRVRAINPSAWAPRQATKVANPFGRGPALAGPEYTASNCPCFHPFTPVIFWLLQRGRNRPSGFRGVPDQDLKPGLLPWFANRYRPSHRPTYAHPRRQRARQPAPQRRPAQGLRPPGPRKAPLSGEAETMSKSEPKHGTSYPINSVNRCRRQNPRNLGFK